MNMWYVCTEARKKRDASGMVGRPTRRTRFWSANAWNKSIFCNPLLVFSEGYGVGHVGVIVFGENVQESPVNGRFRVVEFGNVSMLDPVHQHLAPQHQQEWSHDLSSPVGKHSEAFG